jgi:hypothetical protein
MSPALTTAPRASSRRPSGAGLVNREVKKKPHLQGFLASVACVP